MSKYTDDQLRSIIINRIGYDWVSTVRPNDIYANEDGIETIAIDGDEVDAVRNAADGVLRELHSMGVV